MQYGVFLKLAWAVSLLVISTSLFFAVAYNAEALKWLGIVGLGLSAAAWGCIWGSGNRRPRQTRPWTRGNRPKRAEFLK